MFQVLAVLLIIGGVQLNPGPVVEGENNVRLLCTGSRKNLKSGIQCKLCGRWYHYSCGSVKAQAAEREKWKCDKCRTEKLRMLQEDLQNTLRQIVELKARSRELDAKLLPMGTGKRERERERERGRVPRKQRVMKCVVVGDSILGDVGAEHADVIVECIPGIKTEQLHGMIEKRDLGSPETVIIHVGTNDMRATRNLNFVMAEVYMCVGVYGKEETSELQTCPEWSVVT